MAYPNVLFIISDQHNAKVLGCKGHPDVQTPNLDRLAASGVRFENAITQNPICTPSRVSYLSGQYCHNHGYYGLSGPRPANLPTLFGHLRRHGYASAAIGKIHCPEYWVEDDCDVFHETCECSIGGRSTAYADFLRDRGKLELEDHGRMAEFGKRGQQSMEGRPSPLTYEESQEGWIAATAIEFMQDSVREGKPFVVQTSLPRPHQCTAPSEPFWSMYDGKDLTMPPNADHDLAGKAPHMRNSAIRWRKGEWTLIEPHSFEAGRKRKMQGYLGAISQVDHAVGQIIAPVQPFRDGVAIFVCAQQLWIFAIQMAICVHDLANQVGVGVLRLTHGHDDGVQASRWCNRIQQQPQPVKSGNSQTIQAVKIHATASRRVKNQPKTYKDKTKT